MISINEYFNQLYIKETLDNNTKDKTLLRCAITKFFAEHPNPDDTEVHKLAEKFQIDPHEFEEIIYELLSALLKGVGKHKEVPVTEFDPEQIKMGIEIEKEHTDSEAIAQQIAKDHLAEIPDYYTRLKKMEDEAKKNE